MTDVIALITSVKTDVLLYAGALIVALSALAGIKGVVHSAPKWVKGLFKVNR